MVCRHCGAQIADRALICYRCGTATTEAKYKPAEISRRKPSRMLIGGTLAIVLIVLIVVVVLAGRTEGGDTSRLVGSSAIAIALLLVIARAYFRRR